MISFLILSFIQDIGLRETTPDVPTTLMVTPLPTTTVVAASDDFFPVYCKFYRLSGSILFVVPFFKTFVWSESQKKPLGRSRHYGLG